MIKILHTADWHSDSDPIKQRKLEASLRQMINYCKNNEINAIVISGDIWEKKQSYSDNSGVPMVIEYLRHLSKMVDFIFIVKGNNSHDEPGSVSLLHELEPNIYAYEHPACLEVWSDEEGWSVTEILRNPFRARESRECSYLVSLIPYPTKAALLKDAGIDENNQIFIDIFESILDSIGNIADQYDAPHILAFHGNVQGARLSSGQSLLGQDIIISPFSLQKARADYYALGHIHNAQEILPNMRYSGSIYNKNWGETEEKGFCVVSFDGVLDTENDFRTVYEPLIDWEPLTSTRPMVTVEAEFKDGRFIYENHIPENAQVRFRVRIPENERKLLTEEKLQEIAGIFGEDVKIEPSIIPAEREMRSEKIMDCRSLTDEVEEYAAVISEEVTDSIRTKVQEMN